MIAPIEPGSIAGPRCSTVFRIALCIKRGTVHKCDIRLPAQNLWNLERAPKTELLKIMSLEVALGFTGGPIQFRQQEHWKSPKITTLNVGCTTFPHYPMKYPMKNHHFFRQNISILRPRNRFRHLLHGHQLCGLSTIIVEMRRMAFRTGWNI